MSGKKGYSHLQFLSHGDGSRGGAVGGFAAGSGGSLSAAPALQTSTSSGARTANEKMVDVVEYLQSTRRNQQASLVDIFNDVSVDLQGPDSLVFDMLKSNPKVVVEDDHGSISLQFMTKFEIKCKADLVNLIEKLRLGLSRNEVRDSYPGIADDIAAMVTAGDVLAVSNQQDLVLYPRRKPFLTELSGEVTLTAGSSTVQTSMDLRGEVRRGDAILLGGVWYRVSSVISTSSLSQQPARARPPASVSSLEEMNSRNEYLLPYTDCALPLSAPVAALPTADALSVVKIDGSGETEARVTIKAYKHGCSNDLRAKWHTTFEDMKSRRLIGDDKRLEAELLRLDLISRAGAFADIGKRKFSTGSDSKAKRPRKTARVFKVTNTHLKGTTIGNLLANQNK